MNATRTLDEIEDAGATLAQLRELASQFESKYSFVTEINSPVDYERAIRMLDQLTDGREIGPNEEILLDELTTTLSAYEKSSQETALLNQRWERKLAPAEMLRALIESAGLKGDQLPEIGDKSVVSKILNGKRKISHKMAIALGKRFQMNPDAFLEDTSSRSIDISPEERASKGLASVCISSQHGKAMTLDKLFVPLQPHVAQRRFVPYHPGRVKAANVQLNEELTMNYYIVLPDRDSIEDDDEREGLGHWHVPLHYRR